MIQKNLVSIIIVNWNGKYWLKECLASLRAQRYEHIETIVVDNGSTDGSMVWTKQYYPNVICIELKKNLGFAQTNNLGYKRSHGSYILFLNNDTIVTNNFITEFLRVFASDSRIAGAQSKLLLMDDSRKLDAVGAFLTPTGVLFHYGLKQTDGPRYDKEIDLYTVKGACMMFRRSVLEKVSLHGNLFDPSYFAYFEETDLCHRIWLRGYRIVYAYKSVVYHKAGATSTQIPNAFVQFHSFKNRIHSYLKNLSWLNIVNIMPVHLLFCEAYTIHLLLRGYFSMCLTVQKAILWNIIHMNETLADRRIVQRKIRKRTDRELMPIIMKNPSLGYYFSLLT
jgi:GT2 family glycosyltransferase